MKARNNTALIRLPRRDLDIVPPGIGGPPLQLGSFAQYFEGVRQRFAMKQQQKTALQQTKGMAIELVQVRMAKELAQLMTDLAAAAAERDVRVQRVELERLELQQKKRSLLRQSQLIQRRDRLQLILEITRLKQQILEARQTAPPPLSAAEQRARKRQELESELQHLNQAEAQAVSRASGDEERTRFQNLYADRRQVLLEQLRKYL